MQSRHARPKPDNTALLPPIQAMEKMVTTLDKTHLRPVQKESYLCCARCCDKAAGPVELQQWCGVLASARGVPALRVGACPYQPGTMPGTVSAKDDAGPTSSPRSHAHPGRPSQPPLPRPHPAARHSASSPCRFGTA